ncbi:hypothetical protein AgCh_025105 [Apium graveolens]
MTSESHGTSGTDGSKDPTISGKTRVRRGIVNMLKVKKARTKGIMQKVNWNEIGQPIGKESMTLAYFIGAYARRNFPIVYDDWRKKEWRNVKQTLWDEIKMKDKINSGVKNPIVTRLDTWEYARRDADGQVRDPTTLQVLQDAVAISENLPEHELTNIQTDDLLARAIPLEYAGRVRALSWG